MSRPVRERLRELETDVRDLEVRPAAAVRARGRTRARRQLAAVLVAGAVVATTAGVTFGRLQQTPATDLPVSSPGITCVLTLPKTPEEVRVRVFDGGAPAGEQAKTVARLRAREFTVLEGTGGRRPEAAADVSYGPAAIGSATLLRAALYGEVTMRFDAGRTDDVIDLVIGPAFTRLATTTELNQNLVAAGEPSAPAGC